MNHPSRQAMMDKAIAERQRIRDWLLSAAAKELIVGIIQALYQLRRSTLISISKTTDPYLPSAAVDQVSAMLTLAKQNHG